MSYAAMLWIIFGVVLLGFVLLGICAFVTGFLATWGAVSTLDKIYTSFNITNKKIRLTLAGLAGFTFSFIPMAICSWLVSKFTEWGIKFCLPQLDL